MFFFCLDDDTIGTYEHLISYTNLSLFPYYLQKRGQHFIQSLKLLAFKFFPVVCSFFCDLDGVSLLLSSFFFIGC